MKVTLNTMFREAHGRLDGLVLRRTPSGGTSLIKPADMSNVDWSPAQKSHRLRFKRAVAYAKAALADPAVRAEYESRARKLGKRPFDLAVSDQFKAQK